MTQDTGSAAGFRRTKFACFYTYLAMASVFSLPPLLFITFRETYGISYTLLGTLVLVNYATQLSVDLLFSFFPHRFHPHLCLRIMPLMTTTGLALFALIPFFFPQIAYLGLLIGTVIYSAAAGLNEVLLSPTVAALPSKNPSRDMSTLHSLYAYGVLTVILISTLFFNLFGREKWVFLALFFAVLPLGSFLLFCLSPLPPLRLASEESVPGASGEKKRRFPKGLPLFTLCIFLGSAAENAMTNWISGYMEDALGLSKTVGDLAGMALFITLLGLTRTLYARFGKRIYPMLTVGMGGALICYLVAGLVPLPFLAVIACVFTGMFTSMLWPGTLILMEETFPLPGVAAYALMAAGGDLGGSIAPQLLGAIADGVAAAPWAAPLAADFSLTPAQLGMKVGMLISALFPLFGLILLLLLGKRIRRRAGALPVSASDQAANGAPDGTPGGAIPAPNAKEKAEGADERVNEKANESATDTNESTDKKADESATGVQPLSAPDASASGRPDNGTAVHP